mmetsp:Transcript_26152/g.43247  ORF Transcript_26152/g.43247 Transcript_26152/m.43247 type:complete len:246 (-) Transcript_26152:1391-2128(-)
MNSPKSLLRWTQSRCHCTLLAAHTRVCAAFASSTTAQAASSAAQRMRSRKLARCRWVSGYYLRNMFGCSSTLLVSRTRIARSNSWLFARLTTSTASLRSLRSSCQCSFFSPHLATRSRIMHVSFSIFRKSSPQRLTFSKPLSISSSPYCLTLTLNLLPVLQTGSRFMSLISHLISRRLAPHGLNCSHSLRMPTVIPTRWCPPPQRSSHLPLIRLIAVLPAKCWTSACASHTTNELCVNFRRLLCR